MVYDKCTINIIISDNFYISHKFISRDCKHIYTHTHTHTHTDPNPETIGSQSFFENFWAEMFHNSELFVVYYATSLVGSGATLLG